MFVRASSPLSARARIRANLAHIPKNEEGYDLYLRSISLPNDLLPNKDAIAMLERAVGLDPSHAPVWAAFRDGIFALFLPPDLCFVTVFKEAASYSRGALRYGLTRNC
jgi:hypothetical protein